MVFAKRVAALCGLFQPGQRGSLIPLRTYPVEEHPTDAVLEPVTWGPVRHDLEPKEYLTEIPCGTVTVHLTPNPSR